MNMSHECLRRGRATGPALAVAVALLLAAAALLLLSASAFAQEDAAAPGPAGVWALNGAPGDGLLVLRAGGSALALPGGDGALPLGGAWEVAPSGAVSVTLDDGATLLLFTGDDTLAALGSAFTRLAPAQGGAGAGEGTLVFRSELLPAASSPGLQYTLTLEPGGAAALAAAAQDGEPPVTQLGAWAGEGISLTLELTGTADALLDPPQTIVFTLAEDGTQTLVAAEYDETLFGSAGLALTYVAPGAEEGAADPAGVYTSKVLPGASSPGVVLTLALFENGNLLSTSNYLLDEPAITEQGTWSADETAVTITLTGQIDRAYTEPVTMTWDILPPDQLASDAIVLTKLAQMTPEEMEAVTGGMEEAGGSAATAATAGAYMSGWLPAASSPGLIRTLLLYENGNAQQFSDYLTNDAPPITEFGTWSEVDGSVTLTLTRSLDRDYETPAVETFANDGAGTLTQNGVAFNKLAQAMPGEEQTPTGALGEPMDVPGVFASGWMPAASSPGLIISLALFENGGAQQSSNYLIDDGPVVVEMGEWAAGADGTVVVTMTEQLDGPFAAPVATVWQTAAPDELVSDAGVGMVLTRLEQVLPADLEAAGAAATPEPTGEPAEEAAAAATAEPTAEAAAEPTAEPAAEPTAEPAAEAAPADSPASGAAALAAVALYRSDVLPAAASPGRVIELIVYGDSTVLMNTDFQDGRPPVAEIGAWQDNGDGTATVTLTGRLTQPFAAPVVIVFEDQGDQLVATEWDASRYGSEGLTLVARDLSELE